MREETPIFVREFSKDFAVRLSIEKKTTKITARTQFMYSKLILKIIKRAPLKLKILHHIKVII